MRRALPGGWRFWALAPWAVLVGLMLATGWYRVYLAPWHLGLQVLGLGLLVVAMLATFRSGRTASGGRAPLAWLICGIVPLFVLLAVGPATINLESPVTNAALGKAAGPAAPGQGPLSILDLHRMYDAKQPFPKEVTLVGRVYIMTEQEREKLPDGLKGDGVGAFVYRHVIVCCAADARPVSLGLEDVDLKTLQQGGWYRLRGRPGLTKNRPYSLVLHVDQATPIDPPRMPYIIYNY